MLLCSLVGIMINLIDSYSISLLFDNVATVDIKEEAMEESYAQVRN